MQVHNPNCQTLFAIFIAKYVRKINTNSAHSRSREPLDEKGAFNVRVNVLFGLFGLGYAHRLSALLFLRLEQQNPPIIKRI